MPPSRQYKIVGETLYIFAPLADRLGLNRIKTELENLSFKYEHPDDYSLIMQELSESQLQRDDAFQEFTPAIRRALDQMGVQYEIKARIKSPYSIWQKMQRKHIPFEEVFDILAIRIIFRPQKRENEIAECYAIYAALTQIYKPHPSRFRDWLSTPKANGYQALHNTFMSHQGKWIEVQIRSDRMDDIAEGGFAAHWKYKDVGGQHDEHELDTWVNSIKEILDDPQPDTLDLLDTIKLNLFASELNVFTPKGEIVTLPQGATVLDFAFAIHSMVGSHCMGAKVNHRLVPMSHRLANGDQIEVLTSRQQTIQPDWINYVTTGKARGRITAALRKMARERRKQGEEMLQAFLTARKLPAGNATNNKLAVFHHFTSPADLFLAIGEGKLVLSDADVLHLQGKNVSKGWGWRRFVPFLKEKAVPSSSDVAAAYTPDFVRGINRKAVLDLTDEVLTHCERCPQCRPIHGDEVVAYITPDEHLELHRRACPVALKRKTSDGNNLVAARWNPTHVTGQLYDIPIHVEGIDAPGMLMSIAQAMGEFPHFVLKAIHLDTDDGIFTGTLTIALTSSADVARVCNRLMHIEQVAKANRVDGF
jgi:GTP pyrophosphokinase